MVYAQNAQNGQEDAYNAYLRLSNNLQLRMDGLCDSYPSNFGGCYLNGNTLIILLTENTESIRNFYYNACETRENIDFIKVEYSYQNLLDIGTSIKNSTKNVYESYIDVIENKYYIGVLDESSCISILSDNCPVEFYLLETLPESTSMRGGEGLSVSATFTEPNTYDEYRVNGLVTIETSNGSTISAGDSGGCVIYNSNGTNRIMGCITGKKDGVYSYITPISYIESSGFEFN